jgi:hypothetical protein
MFGPVCHQDMPCTALCAEICLAHRLTKRATGCIPCFRLTCSCLVLSFLAVLIVHLQQTCKWVVISIFRDFHGIEVSNSVATWVAKIALALFRVSRLPAMVSALASPIFRSSAHAKARVSSPPR